ncbi:unnamed protein product [Diatraea saccharalis]|uniref:Uncharacterized protein n=1 Tax=Diatraea saccharalis TaxID=40085 RepID=A0A9N9QX13_9NEOP|nr:unnamed protein product [Diatraea saccharalis]
MIATLRSRSSSETSSYSSHTASSTDTSLCDENEKASDSEPDIPDDDKDKQIQASKDNSSQAPILKDIKQIHSPLIKETITKHLTEIDKTFDETGVKNITDYLDSDAGEPLRTYIDGFETKLKDNFIVSEVSDHFTPVSHLKSISPFSPHITTDKKDILQRLSNKKYEEKANYDDTLGPKNFSKPPKTFTDLSPLDLSSDNKYNIDVGSPYNYDYETNFKSTSHSRILDRPPDIIDSFAMYPNFVPDIDLSEKNVSDIESPVRSPGAESIIVSEDEPPIPLKIDKYFEHSPEFFGARVTDPNNSEIPNRRAVKRNSRLPKKPDSLTLHSNHNDIISINEMERASSLPQSHSFVSKKSSSPDLENKTPDKNKEFVKAESPKNENDSLLQRIDSQIKSPTQMGSVSPKDYILLTGRKNSERALQIIQENSKILSRILTKQHITDTNQIQVCQSEDSFDKTVYDNNITYSNISENSVRGTQIESPVLKESTSDSLIGYIKRNVDKESVEKCDFVKVRPISIDDPLSLELPNAIPREEISLKSSKSPSNECLGNKTDLYGWENKGFLAKYEYKSILDKENSSYDFSYKRKIVQLPELDKASKNDVLRPTTSSEWTTHSLSETKASVTLPSTEPKDTTTYETQYNSEDYGYSFSSKYNDFILSKASDICSKTVDQGPKACEKNSKTENSQVSDFAHVVTSSISFTYEPSAEDDSPTGIKSNSSDTLCQIASLDQVSTPISPKIFPKETSIFHRELSSEKGDKTIVDSDDTCSAITSLIETDTLSSLSYPRSPSSGSYHPFPTRPVMRMPKELGIRLGMYPKDVISSPPK